MLLEYTASYRYIHIYVIYAVDLIHINLIFIGLDLFIKLFIVLDLLRKLREWPSSFFLCNTLYSPDTVSFHLYIPLANSVLLVDICDLILSNEFFILDIVLLNSTLNFLF